MNSSVIKTVSYHNRQLFVEFPNGTMRVYYNVDSSDYRALLLADSPGRYFNEYIKGLHPTEPVSQMRRYYEVGL